MHDSLRRHIAVIRAEDFAVLIKHRLAVDQNRHSFRRGIHRGLHHVRMGQNRLERAFCSLHGLRGHNYRSHDRHGAYTRTDTHRLKRQPGQVKFWHSTQSVDERDSRRIIRYGREGEYFLAWQAVGLSTQAPSQNFSRLAGNERHFFGIDVETPKDGEMRARSATRCPEAFSRTLKALPARRRCTLRRFGGADDLQPC